MKKVLDENSFSSWGNMSEYERYVYLKNNGYVGENKEGLPTWYRKYPIEYDNNIITWDELTQMHIDAWLDELYKQAESDKIPIESYNEYVRHDAWLGGEVENFGYIAVAASSLYGNSIYLPSGSWYACGTPENPVDIAKFYKLAFEKKWNGGDVNTWGRVSNSTTLLGASIPVTNTIVGEETLGCIANIDGSHMGRGTSLQSLRNDFKDFWNEEEKRYDIDSNTLSKYLSQKFSCYIIVEDLKTAIKNHRRIILRKVTHTEQILGTENYYGIDLMLVNYNYVKGTFDCINSAGTTLNPGPIVESIKESDISNGKVKIKTFILSN